MKKLQATLIIMVLVAVMFFGLYWWQSVENRNLEQENHKFQNEIEYLKGKNQVLKEEKRSLKDMYWHLNNDKMKDLQGGNKNES